MLWFVITQKSGWYSKIFQHLTISIHTENESCCFNCPTTCNISEDVMTKIYRLPLDLLNEIVSDIKV